MKSISSGNAEEALEMPLASPETLGFVASRLEIAEEPIRQAFQTNFGTLLEPGKPIKVRELAFRLWSKSQYKLPRPATIDLSGMDLRGFRFVADGLSLLPLHESRWNGTILNDAEFDRADLSGADFSFAKARSIGFRDCQLDRGKFQQADLQYSIWRNLDLSLTDFEGANLRGAYAVSHGNAEGCPWRTLSVNFESTFTADGGETLISM